MSATTPVKPAPCPVLAENIPQTLKAADRWVGWNWALRGDKFDKPPLDIRTGKNASSTNPATWVPFDEALDAHRRGKFDGIGITFGFDEKTGLHFSGLDIDDCYTDGAIDAGAIYLASVVGSYTEKSPSLSGIKVFTLGAIPWAGDKKKDDRKGVEFYDSGRYFTVTGLRLPQFPDDVFERGTILADLNAEIFPRRQPRQKDDRTVALEALAALDPARAGAYWDWVTVGMALKAVSEDLLAEWEKWSQKSGKYVPGECQKKWASFKRGGVGLGSLIHWAKENGWTGPAQETPAKPRIASPSSNGTAAPSPLQGGDDHMGDGLTDNDGAGPWHLKVEMGDPKRFLLRSPIWEKSPHLADGYIVLTEKELFVWSQIRRKAASQAGIYVRPDRSKAPVWDGRRGPRLLARLLKAATEVPLPSDYDRVLAAAEFLVECAGKTAIMRDDNKSEFTSRDIFCLEDGTVLFKLRKMAARAAKEAPGVTFEDIRAAVSRYGDEHWPEIGGKRRHYYRLNPDRVQVIEDEVHTRGNGHSSPNGHTPSPNGSSP